MHDKISFNDTCIGASGDDERQITGPSDVNCTHKRLIKLSLLKALK